MERIGPYRVLQKIAAGGMGTVYLAEHERQHGFRKLVAIKLLHPHLEVGEEAQQRFTVEARIGASLAHPNIVSVHDLDSDSQGGLFFVMEYVHGCSLRTLMNATRGRCFAPPVAALIVGNVLRGLHAAHTALGQDGQPWPVIHRDVNPKNVLVASSGAVKLTDFGIAKIFDQQITVATGLRGTISYMSPEQARGERVDLRTDVYSCGLILYELLIGRRAIEGESEMERLAEAQRGVTLGGSTLAGVPPPLAAVLRGALAPEREARLPSAQAMLVPLEAYLREVGTPPPGEVAALASPHVPALDDLDEETVSRVTATAAATPAAISSLAGGQQAPHGSPTLTRRWRLGLLAAGLVLGAWALVLIVVLARDAGVPAAADAAPVAAVGEDARPAAEAGAAAAQVPADASSAREAAPAPDVRRVTKRPPRRPRARGRLLLNTVPRWSVVWIDGRRRGNTPLDVRLRAGRHRIVVRPLGKGSPSRLTLRIRPGKTTRKVLKVR